MEEAIKAEKLVKRYGELEAVKGISFAVKKGEAYALLGPNGAGKTTTMRMLTTLTSITSGEAYVNGFNVKSESLEVRRSIGLVPDVSNLYDELTVRENLMFAAKLYGVSPSREDELIKEFELPGNRKFGKLSTGFKRRVTIAAALIHEPEILFLDEPTSGLDVRSAKAVRGLIRALNRRGTTVFITTHNMIEAETIPQRIAIIREGKIVAEGRRTELQKLIGRKTKVRLTVEPVTSSLLRALERYSPVFDEGSLVFEVENVDSFIDEIQSLKTELGFRIKKSMHRTSRNGGGLRRADGVFLGGVPFEGACNSREGAQGVYPQTRLNKLGHNISAGIHACFCSQVRGR